MTLENPSKIERLIDWLKMPGKLKLVAVGIGIIVVIGFVLFTVDRCGTWIDNRDIAKQKAAINAKVANIEAKEAVIANLATEIAIEKQQVKDDTAVLLDNINATNEARVLTNQALANLDAARNANTTNSSLKDFQKALDEVK